MVICYTELTWSQLWQYSYLFHFHICYTGLMGSQLWHACNDALVSLWLIISRSLSFKALCDSLVIVACGAWMVAYAYWFWGWNLHSLGLHFYLDEWLYKACWVVSPILMACCCMSHICIVHVSFDMPAYPFSPSLPKEVLWPCFAFSLYLVIVLKALGKKSFWKCPNIRTWG